MNDSIDWLVFDLGGVLVDVAPLRVTLDDLAMRTATPVADLASLLRECFTATPLSLAERFQLGTLDEAGFHAALNAKLVRALAFDDLIAALEAIPVGIRTDTARLLARLAPRYRTACYSNTNPKHWHHKQCHFAFFWDIERRFASHEPGYAKPDPRGYAAVVTALDAAPQRCLLIDDRAVNVEAARAAGWQALVFEDADTLERDLAALGITAEAAA